MLASILVAMEACRFRVFEDAVRERTGIGGSKGKQVTRGWRKFFFLVSLGGVRLSPLGTSATVGLLYQPLMIDDDNYGAVGGMRIGRGNRSTRRKPAPLRGMLASILVAMETCRLRLIEDAVRERTGLVASGRASNKRLEETA
jgi:hypothetical protein